MKENFNLLTELYRRYFINAGRYNLEPEVVLSQMYVRLMGAIDLLRTSGICVTDVEVAEYESIVNEFYNDMKKYIEKEIINELESTL